MAKKRSFKHFRDRDAPTDWVRPLEEVSFTKVVKKKFNQLNQLELWPEEDLKAEDSVVTAFRVEE